MDQKEKKDTKMVSTKVGRPQRVVNLLNRLHPARLGRNDTAENFDRLCRDLEMRDLQEAAR